MESPFERRARYNLAQFGEAIGDPSRAAMLIALMGGVARPASDLARIAGVAPSTATSHLRCLEEGGLVVVRAQGRHRYYSLSGPLVAAAVESLGACAPERRTSQRRSGPGDAMGLARTCYGHLAGRLSIAFWTRARDDRWVRWSEAGVSLLPRGRDVLARTELLREPRASRLEGRLCLDWSERVPHVAGPLGIAICEALLAKGWVARTRESRALRITARGDGALRELGVTWDRKPA